MRDKSKKDQEAKRKIDSFLKFGLGGGSKKKKSDADRAVWLAANGVNSGTLSRKPESERRKNTGAFTRDSEGGLSFLGLKLSNGRPISENLTSLSNQMRFGTPPASQLADLDPDGRPFAAAIDGAIAAAPPSIPSIPVTRAPGTVGVGVGPGGGHADHAGHGEEAPFDIVGAQLAALGAGPNRGDYVAPFDAAEARARGEYDKALPQIARAYEDLRGRLQAGQGQFADEQARLSASQMSTQDQLRAQLQAEMGATSRDLATQSGGSPVPSLAAGLQAQQQQLGTNLSDAAGRQKAFLDNLARTQESSSQARLADSQVAQQAATANAGVNLNDILGRLELQKAGALRQFGGDERQFQQSAANIKIQGMREAAELARSEAKERDAAAKEREAELKTLEKEIGAKRDGLIKSNASVSDFMARDPRAKSMPRTFTAFNDIMRGVTDSGGAGRATAHAKIDTEFRQALTQADPEAGFAYGSALNPDYLHKLVDEYYDQEEQILGKFLDQG